MESTEYAFDELLCQSLLLFRQSRFYDNYQESEVEAYRMLEEAKLLINETHNSVDMAKWGCAFECLVQKYYINGDTDNILGDIDVTLINFWKKVDASSVGVFPIYLWLGYYFLLRLKNQQSCCHVRCRRMMSDILSFLIEFFHKYRNRAVPMSVLTLFTVDVWGETVYWVELVHNSSLCEKQSGALLRQLYNLSQAELVQNRAEPDNLLQRILEFYCF